jgi:hypothetical protein
MTVIYYMSIDRADKPWIGDRRLTEICGGAAAAASRCARMHDDASTMPAVAPYVCRPRRRGRGQLSHGGGVGLLPLMPREMRAGGVCHHLSAACCCVMLVSCCTTTQQAAAAAPECTLNAGEDGGAEGLYAYVPSQAGYLPGCVIGDMDHLSGGGCRHYHTLAQAVKVCDQFATVPPGCMDSTEGQHNGCTCAGVTKEWNSGGGSPKDVEYKPFRLGAFSIIADAKSKSFVRSEWLRRWPAGLLRCLFRSVLYYC